jgi:hypothetical protein
MKMKGIIDRFEGKYAVIELQDRQMLNIDKTKLPVGAKEGMVIHIAESITIDIAETKKRREEIKEMTKDLWEE